MNKYMYSSYTYGTGICSAVCEYIWIDGKGSICSKSRVIKPLDINHIPDWNYDASSTYQAPSDGNTEGILKPILVLEDPLRAIDKHKCFLVLCETYDSEGNP